MIYSEKIFWSIQDASQAIPMLLKIKILPLMSNYERYVSGKCVWLRKEGNVTIGRIQCRWNKSSLLLNIIHFRNECRKELEFFENRKTFSYIGAWLLQRVVLFLTPEKEIRNQMKIRLVADGIYLNEQKKDCLNHKKLVAYYQTLGFIQRDFNCDDENCVMFSNAEKTVQKIQNLLSRKIVYFAALRNRSAGLLTASDGKVQTNASPTSCGCTT